MGVPRYPLKRENVLFRVASEHARNQVDNRLRVGSLEPPAGKTLLSVPSAAELRSTRVTSWSEADIHVKLAPAFRAVKNTRDPVSRRRYRPTALVFPGVRQVSGKHLVSPPP